jgi:nitrate reductase NapE component
MIDIDEEEEEESETQLLRQILDEMKELNVQLARTDQRSRTNKDNVESLRENRVAPLEADMDSARARVRSNEQYIRIAIGVLTILTVGAVSYGFTLL